MHTYASANAIRHILRHLHPRIAVLRKALAFNLVAEACIIPPNLWRSRGELLCHADGLAHTRRFELGQPLDILLDEVGHLQHAFGSLSAAGFAP